ncbi:endonuclease III [Vagococcus zengguangii]|uniref:Endonuclease III n=1 Tax=Vagococcus zengguangii TaxID=2571750 RepID=A0A4D7CW44_9ENTE|nr:endonuclease III [Vagococcus zengguangii]QCI86400.1 endonuclease III [Vagococcus zengguangii]TLG81350.1 endonuclease III [Vagococcus zengguangii]
MLSKAKTMEAIDLIASMYPDAECELVHKNPFELLTAVILSAQTTDVSVNKVTPYLFEKFPTPQALAEGELTEIEEVIKTIGLYRNKAKHIKGCSQKLVAEFAGEVPKTIKELVSLPGVGKKTANVVVSTAFGVPAIAVDTHVERVSKRLRIVKQSANVTEVEETLMKKIPKERWSKTHHQLIFFGRYHCTARKPKCEACPLLYMCAEGQKNL